MPQDVRLTPDGTRFLVADMLRNGIWVIKASTQRIERFIPTGKGTHGIYPDRDGRRIFVSNRDEVYVLDTTTGALVKRSRSTQGRTVCWYDPSRARPLWVTRATPDRPPSGTPSAVLRPSPQLRHPPGSRQVRSARAVSRALDPRPRIRFQTPSR
jgi:hypothetical protein